MPMKKVEVIIEPHRLSAIRNALYAAGVEALTVCEARGHGRNKGHTELYRGCEYRVEFVPQIKLETVVYSDDAEDVVSAVLAAARAGKIAHGKIFVYDVYDARRIRTGEIGPAAL